MIMQRSACFLRGVWLSVYVNAKSEVDRANLRLGNREQTGELGGAGRQRRLLERVHEEARKVLSSYTDVGKLSRPLAEEDGGLITLAWKVRLLTRMQDVEWPWWCAYTGKVVSDRDHRVHILAS